ncbi:replicative DNA helicase [Entomospira culicis]|uniref:Replicative DNA helicase n=1 Tax=Entomospira culicis TaxID=2719989 RepID=A0A968GG41_9SPIO|nr:replicative DNA helicase [Entomospira culicis]NIZ19423.1 replicative DNA helicase [Entomospira culicis]NIZ69672.1 replicative DNA helicase [Entomospira culicis]WDI36782.1 replicative DNA helicase [Entomospira culicis]WDI38411.1 replicative DNA helicase [Entomospira culicis]
MEERANLFDLAAERALIGTLLSNFKVATLDKIEELIAPQSFFNSAHQVLFEAIRFQVEHGQPVDVVSLTHALRSRDLLEKAGGTAYLTELTATAPLTSTPLHYANIVREFAIRRSLKEMGIDIAEESTNLAQPTETLIEHTQQKILDLDYGSKISAYYDARQLVKNTLEILEERFKNKIRYTGIESKFSELDNMLSGFQDGEMIVIGARPSMGKTALALSFVENLAIKQQIATGFFTLEMPAEQLVMRMLASESQVNSIKFRSPSLMLSAELSKISDAASRIYDAPLYIDDTPNISLSALKLQARKMKIEKNIKVLFIDYLGLITVKESNLARHEQMALVSRNIKALARELKIPVIILSQLRRDAEGKEPNLADLRETGSIEQDADVVMFLHRTRKTDNETADEGLIETKLIIAKQRNGPIGVAELVFHPRFTRFYEKSREH